MTDNSKLIKPVITLIISLVVLAIIGAVIGVIPGLPFIALGLVSVVIALIMIILLLKFGSSIGPVLEEQYPNINDLPQIAMNVIYLICLGIAYGAISTLLTPIIGSLIWILGIIVLIAALYLVYLIVIPLLRNSGNLTEAIAANVTSATSSKKTCKKCETENPSANKFCDKCGNPLNVNKGT